MYVVLLPESHYLRIRIQISLRGLSLEDEVVTTSLVSVLLIQLAQPFGGKSRLCKWNDPSKWGMRQLRSEKTPYYILLLYHHNYSADETIESVVLRRYTKSPRLIISDLACTVDLKVVVSLENFL